VPKVDSDVMERLASASPKARDLHHQIAVPMLSIPPHSLGFPSDHAQSAYSPGSSRMTKEEISSVSQQLESLSISPENTRIRKVENTEKVVFEVLQASVEIDTEPQEFGVPGSNHLIRLVRGDYSAEMAQICSALSEASKYADNPRQQIFLSQCAESFQTGNLERYRDLQRTWVSDLNPRIESIFGFVEPYRDPFGTRAEFEALVATANPEETKVLTKLVENSTPFI
jgi:dipeptidyl-peptidase III